MSTIIYINIVFSVIIILMTISYHLEKSLLREFIADTCKLGKKELDLALEVAGRVFAKIPNAKDPVLPLLEPLGGTPGRILKRGGCCSGKSRLTILCLREVGIKANQATLYHFDKTAQHALVNVSLRDSELLVDPTYGFYYVDQYGSLCGISRLRSGAVPKFRSLPYSNAWCYPGFDYYNFAYTETKTANWTKSRFRKLSYKLLLLVTLNKIETLKYPWYLEWPQLIINISTVVVMTSINISPLILTSHG